MDKAPGEDNDKLFERWGPSADDIPGSDIQVAQVVEVDPNGHTAIEANIGAEPETPETDGSQPKRTSRRLAYLLGALAAVIGLVVGVIALTPGETSFVPGSTLPTQGVPVRDEPQPDPTRIGQPVRATQISQGRNDVSAQASTVTQPTGLATTPDGRTFLVDASEGWVREVTTDGLQPAIIDESTAATANLGPISAPGLITSDSFGGLIVAAHGGSVLSRYDPQGTLSEFAKIPPQSEVTAIGADRSGNVAVAWKGTTGNSTGAFLVNAVGTVTEFAATNTAITAFLAVADEGWFGASGDQLVSLSVNGVTPTSQPPQLPGTGSLRAVSILPGGRLAVARSNDRGEGSGGISIWDPTNQAGLSPVSGVSISALTISSDGRLLATDPDGRRVLAIAIDSPDRVETILSDFRSSGEQLTNESGEVLAIDLQLKPAAVAISASGTTIIAERDRDRLVAVTDTGTLRAFTEAVTPRPTFLAATDTQVAVVGEVNATTSQLTLFDTSGKVLDQQALPWAASPIAYSPEGRLLAGRSDGGLEWVDTRAPVIRPSGEPISALTIDSLGKIFVVNQTSNAIEEIVGNVRQPVVSGIGDPFIDPEGNPGGLLGLNDDKLATISGLTAIGPDRLVVSDVASDRLRLVEKTATGQWSIAPFRGVQPSEVLSSPLSQRVAEPSSLATGIDGTVVVALRPTGVVRRIDPDGTVRTIAGGGLPPAAAFGSITGLALIDGLLIASDAERHRIIAIDDGNLRTVFGSGSQGSESTDLDTPVGVAGFDGVTYIVDSLNHRVLAADSTGVAQAVLGTGVGGQGDASGAGPSVALNEPSGIAIDSNGALIVTDTGNNRVLRVGRNGMVSLVGNVNRPTGIAVRKFAGKDLILVSAPKNHQVFAFDELGNRSVFAGIGTPGSDGDGRLATAARFDSPSGLAVSPDGSVFVVDAGARNVRRIDPEGFASTTTGVEKEFTNPRAIVVDDNAGLIVGDAIGRLFRLAPPELSVAAPGWNQLSPS